MLTKFSKFELKPTLLKALNEIGYETPTPIQDQIIPLLLEKKDVLGQAQTGTGKTAAFALPLLSNLNLRQKDPQILVLTPTRELAIQVAEAFKKYASNMKSFHVLPIYGGQEYRRQIRGLKRGVHVVVGTPGRVMDHMRRGTLKLEKLNTLVLDEADEMLRMGFIDDVKWILEKTPSNRQIALFSATMPQNIRSIAKRYLKDPEQITIKLKTTTAVTICQRFWPVNGMQKLEALTRILEVESFETMLIFVRTKTATVELSTKLEARGYASCALNGDIKQNQRERIINYLKSGKIDILVATDVAARGLDVDRISHVVNFDMPHDTEGYVHRIGRTGRAGRKGNAILFVAPQEKRMLHSIEKATNQKIEIMQLPSTELLKDHRITKFKQLITDTLAKEELGFFFQMIEQYKKEHNVPSIEIAAALALLLQENSSYTFKTKFKFTKKDENFLKNDAKTYKKLDREQGKGRGKRRVRAAQKKLLLEKGMECFRIEVGHNHRVKIKNIVDAIAKKSGLGRSSIGSVNVYGDYSEINLPEGMPKDVFKDLKKVKVLGQQLKISNINKDHKSGNSHTNFKEKNTLIRKKVSKKTKLRQTVPVGLFH